MSQISAVLIFGAPGSGKGTVGAKLAATTALKHLSTGDIFRGIAPSSESGKLLASYSSKGLLVPDEATVEIFGRFVEGLVNTNKLNPEKDTLLLDGIPRTVAQVDLIKPIVDVKHIFVLDIKDEETIVARLLNRALRFSKSTIRRSSATSLATTLRTKSSSTCSRHTWTSRRTLNSFAEIYSECTLPRGRVFFLVGVSYTKNL